MQKERIKCAKDSNEEYKVQNDKSFVCWIGYKSMSLEIRIERLLF